jgi:ribosomal protein S18 acetylase RimI-like enzyme
MKVLEQNFTQQKHGFNGYYKIIILKTKEEEFKKFLDNHTNDNGMIFKAINEIVADIVVIQNLKIEKSYQNKGHGSQLLKEILKNYDVNYAILSCDVTQNQRFGFILENFYERHNFKAIEYYQDFPLMLYPQDLAKKILNSTIHE